MTKSLKLHYKTVFKPKRRRPEVHFANFIPSGLPRFWTHFSVGVRHIARDYSVALIATGVVVIVVTGALFIRLSERATLADLLLGRSNTSQGYATLLSKDQADALKRNEANDQTARAPAGNPSSFAINSDGGSSTTPPPSGGSGGTTPPPPFSASIDSFAQGSVNLECSSSKPNKGSCSKRYVFDGGIRTQNGPGTVNYGWRSSLASANQDSSFAAGSGSVLTLVQQQVILACNSSVSFSMQLVITSPSPTQSTTLNIDHNCNEI